MTTSEVFDNVFTSINQLYCLHSLFLWQLWILLSRLLQRLKSLHNKPVEVDVASVNRRLTDRQKQS